MDDVTAHGLVISAFQKRWGRAPTIDEAEITQAIARLETGYGRAGQFANMAAQGIFNWGALQRGTPDASGNCPPGMFAGEDAGAPGAVHAKRCFFGFASDADAAVEFVRVLTQTHWDTVPAMNSGAGAVLATATAMRKAPAYYEGLAGTTEAQKIAAYANAIASSRAAIRRALGEAPLAPLEALEPEEKASRVAWGVGMGLAAAAAFAWYRHGKRKEAAEHARAAAAAVTSAESAQKASAS